jgi:peptidoglycan/LPS O-acetylase OafA/YrhL
MIQIEQGPTDPPAVGTGARINRSVGLDVVRSLAILFVLMSHFGMFFASWSGCSLPIAFAVGGFFGVELFFVLSGFLIGRLLIDILDTGVSGRAWLVFMVRRWVRTLPLYFVCVALLALVWPPEFWVPGHAALWRDLPWFLTLTQNLAWPMVGGWFGVSWSLTVEEWFYLSFSGLLFAAAFWTNRRLAFWGVVALFLVAPAWLRWRLPESVNWDEVTSKVVLYRLDAIAFGVMAAWLSVRNTALVRYPRALLVAGLVIIGLLWGGWLMEMVHMRGHVRATFMFDVASLGFALCMPAATLRWDAPRWLAFVAASISARSYALYLIHLSLVEIITFDRLPVRLGNTGAAIATVAIAYGLADLSFRFFESPLLRLRPRQHARRDAATYTHRR